MVKIGSIINSMSLLIRKHANSMRHSPNEMFHDIVGRTCENSWGTESPIKAIRVTFSTAEVFLLHLFSVIF